MMQDFQLAYKANYGYPIGKEASSTIPYSTDSSPNGFLNPGHFVHGSNLDNFHKAIGAPNLCPPKDASETIDTLQNQFGPCPNLVSQFKVPASIYDSGLGMTSVNYRNERLAARLAGSGTTDENDPGQVFRSLSRGAPLDTQTPLKPPKVVGTGTNKRLVPRTGNPSPGQGHLAHSTCTHELVIARLAGPCKSAFFAKT